MARKIASITNENDRISDKLEQKKITACEISCVVTLITKGTKPHHAIFWKNVWSMTIHLTEHLAEKEIGQFLFPLLHASRSAFMCSLMKNESGSTFLQRALCS